MQLPRTHASRVALGAGLVGGTLALALVTGVGPAPALSDISSSQQADDSTSTSSTSSTSSTVAAAQPAGGTRVVDAGGAGTVTVSDDGGQLSIVSAVPATGWSAEIERAAGREVEVDFRRGAQRVQVNVELEDGAVRERVRFRDDAAGTDDDRFDDHHADDPFDDHGGDDGVDDSGASGRGGHDDPPGDDHGADG